MRTPPYLPCAPHHTRHAHPTVPLLCASSYHPCAPHSVAHLYLTILLACATPFLQPVPHRTAGLCPTLLRPSCADAPTCNLSTLLAHAPPSCGLCPTVLLACAPPSCLTLLRPSCADTRAKFSMEAASGAMGEALVDVRGCNLHGLDLRGKVLSGVLLSNADLSGSNLSGELPLPPLQDRSGPISGRGVG